MKNWKIIITALLSVGFFAAIGLYNFAGGESLGNQGIERAEGIAIAAIIFVLGLFGVFLYKYHQKNKG